MKLDRQSKQFFFMSMLFFFTFTFMIGAWTLDIGCSALVTGGKTYSIFGIRDPNITYHLGLLITIISFIAMCAMLCYLTATMR